jgi:hypothetical protein
MAGGHGGRRRGSGRPLGAKNLRNGTSAALIEAARIDENLIPVKFEGDSLAFLKATMEGKIWPTREQIYAAKSVLPIEYAPAVTVEDAIAQQRSIFLSSEYMEFEKRALRVLRKHPEVLADWITEFGDPLVAIDGYDNGYRAEEPINARDTAGDGRKQQPPPNEVGDG